MRVLLDTHAFLWGVADDPRLSPGARRAISGAHERFLSIVSCWEIAIKVSSGRLSLEQPFERFIHTQLALNPFDLLAIDLEDIARAATLPFHHRDPFDRMLAAQALNDELVIVSADPIFGKYGATRAW